LKQTLKVIFTDKTQSVTIIVAEKWDDSQLMMFHGVRTFRRVHFTETDFEKQNCENTRIYVSMALPCSSWNLVVMTVRPVKHRSKLHTFMFLVTENAVQMRTKDKRKENWD
jgi:hypothetical protein